MKNGRTRPIRATNNVTSTATNEHVLYRKLWREDGMTASSTDVATSGDGGGVAPTRITLTPASRSGSFDVDSGVSAGATSYRDGQHTSSQSDNKKAGRTKPGGRLLARGHKLLKHLAHRTENNRTGK